MMLAVRRLLAGAAVGVAVLSGAAAVVPAQAETASPTPIAATVSPTASPTSTGGSVTDPVDVIPDNSRQVWALAGAGALAILAAAVVFFRRR